MNARAAALSCLAWLAVAAAPAAAQIRVVVQPFEGQLSIRARDSIVTALDEGGITVVSQQEAAKVASATDADMSRPSGRVAVARELKLNAIVEGTVDKRGSSFVARITLYAGSTGQQIETMTVRGKKATLPRLLRKQAIDELGNALASAQPPEAEAEEEPEPELKPITTLDDEEEQKPKKAKAKAKPVDEDDEEEAQAEAEPEPEPAAEEREPDGEQRPLALEAGLGVRVLTRSMIYRDKLVDLGEHSLEATPEAVLQVRWYPGAHASSGAVAHIGLELMGGFMYPVDVGKDGFTFTTSSLEFGAGLRGRLPLGAHELGISAGYGQHHITIGDAEGGVDPGVPSMAYGFLRFGLDGRVQLIDALAVRFGGAYRLLLGYGELGEDEWFSHASGGALDAELGLRISLSEALAIDVGGGMVRYFLALEPDPDDPGVSDFGRIAGGLADQYFFGGAGLTLRL